MQDGMGGALQMIGYMNRLGQLVREPFDVDDPMHEELMEIFADGCPECAAALQVARRRKERAQRGEA